MLSHIECLFLFFCYRLGDHRDLHVLTHAFPTRRSSDLEKLELYSQQGIGCIIRINTVGTGREVYTYGIRNSVGHDFNPANGDLWFTDNQVDGMGDDIPPGELNRQTSKGQHFGFPWYGGGDVRTNEYADAEPPADAVFPAVTMTAHAADPGMHFYPCDPFPEESRGGKTGRAQGRER